MTFFLRLLLLCFLLPAAANASDTINVQLDKGQLIRLSGTAKSVFIANPAIADIQMLSPDSLMVFGKKIGETALVAVDGSNRTLINQRVIVTQDLGSLTQALQSLSPNNAIQVQAIPGGIVLSGNVLTAGEAENARKLAARYVPEGGEVINRLTISGPSQVMLRVRFAEMQRSVNKAFGINLQAVRADNFTFGIATGYDFISDTGAIIKPAGGNGALFGSYKNGKYDLNGLIDALETEGLTTILAEPSLTATNGETASFLAGGEIPIPVPDDNGTISITYKPYGVSLAFTPTLIDGDHINLRVKPEVSQVSTANSIRTQGITVPSFTTRRAETTVDVGSGQSFVIAGLLQNNTSQTTTKYPGLGDLPVLGPLFRSNSFLRDESELVIIVTPYIVKPVNGRLAGPTDGYDVPGDAKRIVLDKHLSSVSIEPVAKLVKQPVGYTVE